MSGTSTGPDDLRALLRALPVLHAVAPAWDVAAAPEDPVSLHVAWLRAAIGAGVPEPHAMVLATVDGDGLPDARVLILKALDAAGWRFAGNPQSPKGRQLARHPVAALTSYWPTVGRQVRVRGPVLPADPGETAADAAARNVSARAEARRGRQSLPVGAPTPPALGEADSWQVWRVVADSVEFWQADPDRRHTRLRYLRTPEGSWRSERLWA